MSNVKAGDVLHFSTLSTSKCKLQLLHHLKINA